MLYFVITYSLLLLITLLSYCTILLYYPVLSYFCIYILSSVIVSFVLHLVPIRFLSYLVPYPIWFLISEAPSLERAHVSVGVDGDRTILCQDSFSGIFRL